MYICNPGGGGVGQDHVNPDFADSALLTAIEFVWRKEKTVLLG